MALQNAFEDLSLESTQLDVLAALGTLSQEATLQDIKDLLEETRLGQILDDNNTATLTSVDASPGNPWIGLPTAATAFGAVGELLTVISTEPLSGTYTFEFGPDGINWPVSITVPVQDFSTIKFRKLLNIPSYYRAQFVHAAGGGCRARGVRAVHRAAQGRPRLRSPGRPRLRGR